MDRITKTRRLAAFDRSRRYRPLLMLIVISWLLVLFTIHKIDPATLKDVLIPGSYAPMGVEIFFACFFLFSLLLLSSRRALLWSIAIVFFLYLRLWQIAGLWTALSLFGLLVCLELYFYQKNRPQTNDPTDTITQKE